MSYAGSGYLYGAETLPVKPGAGDPALEPSPDSSGIGPTDFNKLESFRQSAAAHALAADFQGYADMAGGPPGPAPAGQVYHWAESGDLFLSRNNRQKRQVFYDIDVSEFGTITPNSTLAAATNTATIQAAQNFAFNNVLAVSKPCRLIFPPGTIYISDGATTPGLGLLWKGNSGAAPEWVGSIGRGDSFDDCGTTLAWQGTDNATMVYGQSINGGRMRDFFLYGNGKAGKTCWTGAVQWGTANLAASANYEFINCRFGFVKVGVAGNGAFTVGTDPTTTGGDTYQSSDSIWRNCTFWGEGPSDPSFTYAGMQAHGWKTLAGGNCKNFVLDHCEFILCKRAVDWNNASGYLNVLGTSMADVMVCFQQSSAGQLTVIGGDAENGHVPDSQLLVGTGGGGATSAAINGFEFAAFMAGVLGTAISYAGHLSLYGNYFENGNASVSGGATSNPYKIVMGGIDAGNISSLISMGNTFACPHGAASSTKLYPPFFDGSGNWLAPDISSIYLSTTAATVRSSGDSFAPTIGATSQTYPSFDLSRNFAFALSVGEAAPNGSLLAPAYAGKQASGWTKITVPFTSFQIAALTKDVNLSTQWPKTALKRFYMDVTTPFAGPAGAMTMQAGYTGAGSTDIMAAKDVKTAAATYGRDPADLNVAGLGLAANQYSGVIPSKVSNWVIAIRMISAAGNLSGLTAGSVDFYIETELL